MYHFTGSTSTSAQDSSGDITGSGSAAPTVAESINVPEGSSTWEESASIAKIEDGDVGARYSQTRITYYENRIAELERDVAKVREENVKLLTTTTHLTEENQSLLAIVKATDRSNPVFLKQILQHHLGEYFTETQIDCFINKKAHIQWTEEDIVSALTQRSVSAKTYLWIREHWKLPLPSVITLHRWVKDIILEPGILKSVQRMMHSKGKSINSGEKTCILAFDEMKLDTKYAYDKTSDKLYCGKKYVQVVTARGILGNWKQPVFYDYDRNMTKDILFEIIRSIEYFGFEVFGIVNDLGTANRGLLTSLNISCSKHFFPIPCDHTKHIYVF